MPAKDPEKRRAYDKARTATPEGREKRRAVALRCATSPQGKALKALYNRKYKYKLTEDQLSRVRDTTVCDACGSAFTRPGDKHLDHDHATGLFRGVLCQGCNLAEGFLKGSLDRVLALGVYLEKHRLDRDRPAS